MNINWTDMFRAMRQPVERGGLLTPKQLAERWQVPTSHVYRLARDHKIPAVRLGRYVRFRADAVEAYERKS